jgi:protein O-mannosyl-transferase
MKKEKPKGEFRKKDKPQQNLKNKKQINKFSYLDIIGLICLVLLGIIIYSNSFDCSFHLDDEQSIVNNASIRNLFDIKSIWNYNHSRFISYYSLALNYHFNQVNVWGYHLFNLIIHLINACLVWWLTLLIFSSPAMKDNAISKHKYVIAILTAFLFVSHPLATQSVTYIVQRMSSLATLFYFLSIAFYMKARLQNNSSVSKYLLFICSFISIITALYTKENTYTIPLAIVLVEIFFFQTKKFSINFKDYRVILLILGLVGFLLMAYFRFSHTAFKPIPPDKFNDYKTITSLNYLLTQFSVIVKYIQLLFIPLSQNLDYNYKISESFFEPGTMICFLLLLSLLALAIYLFKRNRLISFGIFWFFLTISIESSIIPISDLIFEHRTYLPSLGFFLILSSGIFILLWNKYKYIAIAIFLIIIGFNSYQTFERNKVWKDEFTLWNDVTIKSPEKARGFYNCGVYLVDKKQPDKAMADYNKAIELQPLYAEAYNNRGVLFRAQKKYDEALKDYDTAIKLNPKYSEAYNNRGNLFENLKKFDDALKNYNKAIGLNPKYADAYCNRGVLKFNSGKKEAACIDFQKSAKLGYKAAIDYASKYCH